MPIASSATPVERATTARSAFSAVRSRITWLRAAEAGLLLVTLGLRLWGLNQNGFGIDYYSAAVRSLEEWIAERRRWARLYAELLADAPVTLPEEPALGRHVYHLYAVRSARRDDLQNDLQSRGIATIVHYPTPVHRQPAYVGLGYDEGSFPEAERACAEVLSLPLYPELCEAEVRRIAEVVRSVR